tara:strand:+ start:2099 stop:3247 length:1149 start_codon:yes stop_codon:yes gene_type:complete
MKKLIFWKFFKDISLFFMMVCASISLIIWVIQAVNYLDMVSEDGHAFKVYFLYTSLSLPKIFSKVLPFVFFISVFYMILKYERNNELLIFWITGVHKSNFIDIITRFTLFYLFVQILLTTLIVPQTLNTARSYIKSSDVDVLSSVIRERKFIDSVKNLTIFVEKKRDDGVMENIFLKEKISENNSQIIYAREGKFKNINKDILILYEGEVINQSEIYTNNFSFKETEINLSRFSTQQITDIKIQENSTVNLIKCFINLKKYQSLVTAKIREDNNLETNCMWNNYDVINKELVKRFILPFYIPVLSLIACMIIMKSKDEFNFNKYISILFLGGVLIVIISELSIKYTSENNLNNIYLSLLPILIFIMIYIFFKIKLKNPKFIK